MSVANSARRLPHPDGSLFPKQRARKRGLPAFTRRLKVDRPRLIAQGRVEVFAMVRACLRPRTTDVRSWPELT